MSNSAEVESSVGDPRLVEERQNQIATVAVKLFSEKGYYKTTILDISKKAGISSGLIYKYFKEKEDILYLTLMMVLRNYETEIPKEVEKYDDPIEKLCGALRAYCRVVDRLKEATVLAYRSTKSLPPNRRVFIKEAELKTNALINKCFQDCIDRGYLQVSNIELMVYQLVMFSHAWALKNWSFGKKYTIDQYVDEGIQLLIVPHLNAEGRNALKNVLPSAMNKG